MISFILREGVVVGAACPSTSLWGKAEAKQQIPPNRDDIDGSVS